MHGVTIRNVEGVIKIIFCIAGTQDVTLADVLHFMCGATKLPASGFNTTPKIHFTDEFILPKSSTCD